MQSAAVDPISLQYINPLVNQLQKKQQFQQL